MGQKAGLTINDEQQDGITLNCCQEDDLHMDDEHGDGVRMYSEHGNAPQISGCKACIVSGLEQVVGEDILDQERIYRLVLQIRT